MLLCNLHCPVIEQELLNKHRKSGKENVVVTRLRRFSAHVLHCRCSLGSHMLLYKIGTILMELIKRSWNLWPAARLRKCKSPKSCEYSVLSLMFLPQESWKPQDICKRCSGTELLQFQTFAWKSLQIAHILHQWISQLFLQLTANWEESLTTLLVYDLSQRQSSRIPLVWSYFNTITDLYIHVKFHVL